MLTTYSVESATSFDQFITLEHNCV